MRRPGATVEARTSRRVGPILATLVLVAGCAAGAKTSDHPEVVWRSGADFVQIEPQEAGAPPNEHPPEFAPAEIRQMLRSIEVLQPPPGRFFLIGGGGAKHHTEPVFLPAELEKIDAAVAYALAHAGPHEDVTFAVSGLRRGEPLSLLSETRSTAARVFFADGRLNLIFGDFQVEHRKQLATRDHPYFGYVSKIEARRNPLRPGSRVAEASLPFPLVLRAGDHHAAADGEPRADWVVISPELALTGGAAQGRANDAGQLIRPPARYFDRPGDPWAGTSEQLPTAETSTVEARIARLKDLLDRGLITEDIYSQRAAEILGDL